MEYDPDVRASTVDILVELGYRVLKARDAASALTVIEAGPPIDLLFTDVVMPGTMKSTEPARKAREKIPNIPVLFTSAYTENAIVHGGRLDAGVELISKPYPRGTGSQNSPADHGVSRLRRSVLATTSSMRQMSDAENQKNPMPVG